MPFFNICCSRRNRRFQAGVDRIIERNQPEAQQKMEANIMLATISGARGLYMKNKTSLDAFVTVTLQGKGSLRSRAATEAITTEGECQWDEVCEFKLSEKFSTVAVSVLAKTKLGSGELIGKYEMDIESAKQLNGQTNWLRLKKKNSDEKYRGEVQIKLEFSYEKPSMSVSSLSLNQIGGDVKEGGSGGKSLMSKMKRKIKEAKGGRKQAEDTMSMASAWSATSAKSTKSQRFFGKIGKTLGIKEKDKNATLPAGTFLTPGDNHLETSNGLYETCNDQQASRNVSRNSSFNVFDQPNISRPNSSFANNSTNPFAVPSPQPRTSTPSQNAAVANHNKFGQGIGGMVHSMTSPAGALNHTDIFRRSGSIRSVASSGFESSKYPQKTVDPNNVQDLLTVIDSLKLELQVKDSRMNDMQTYMDNLISRVMERNPELLAAPIKEQKSKLRFF
ncbi:unnamed protein product [Caenorhabditis angaria]|uniref:C2 domain-containing protein n=1 Tax=Caenorhabditis angaria TaxID=860376 RepID=A0A9P1MYI0_9PELO|nr:unnamed protein product [Caenorhabditis angaria]